MKPLPLDLLARIVYSLNFPRREFDKLPESVQEAYRMDAAKIKRILVEGGYVEDDREASDNQSRRG